MNDQFINDIKKSISSTPIDQELSPGSVDRRYEPVSGLKKHNERIHRESSKMDIHGNLPFTFGKPPKARGRSIWIKCDNCGHVSSATSITVGVICRECGQFSSVTEV